MASLAELRKQALSMHQEGFFDEYLTEKFVEAVPVSMYWMCVLAGFTEPLKTEEGFISVDKLSSPENRQLVEELTSYFIKNVHSIVEIIIATDPEEETEPTFYFELDVNAPLTLSQALELQRMIDGYLDNLGIADKVALATPDRIPPQVGLNSDIGYPEKKRDRYFQDRDLQAEGALNANKIMEAALREAELYKEKISPAEHMRLIADLRRTLRTWSYEGYFIPEIAEIFDKTKGSFNSFLAMYRSRKIELNGILSEVSLDILEPSLLQGNATQQYDTFLRIWRIMSTVLA